MNATLRNTLIAICIPVIYGLVLRIFFGIDTWEQLFGVMSVSFLFCLPTIIGILSIYFSDAKKAENRTYQVFFPWAPVLGFFIITLLASLEGWACWVMILPVFLITASLGGLLGAYLKKRNQQNKLSISLLMLAPIAFAPIESLIETIPSTYKAYTYIDIEAPAEKIWDNVTRVQEIDVTDDTGWLTEFLGFPRPVRAELNYEGVGAYREAVFTKGLVFHETVTEYEDNKKMVFDIKANPHEIPSTTLDEHVVIGGKFFDVLTGTYELEDLGEGKHRLHLYSHFEMKTNFNFYAGWWGKIIMKDIQNNILKVEKKRAEG